MAESPGSAIVDPALASLRLSRTADGRTMATWNGASRAVRAVTCFPWSAPGTFVSLRDEDGAEVALVPALDALEPGSRAVLARALREIAFAFEITQVERVRKEFEIRQWDVACVHGPRTFQTHVDDWPRVLPPNGLLITDVAGDVYVIPDWTALDKASRKQLAVFVD